MVANAKMLQSTDNVHTIITCIQTRNHGLGMELEIGDPSAVDFSTKEYSGVLLQYPDTYGRVDDFGEF